MSRSIKKGPFVDQHLFEKIDKLGSIQWPCNDEAPNGTPIMHIDEFVRVKGKFIITKYGATDEKVTRKFPLILTTGRILSQYNVGAQTRRTGEDGVDPSHRRLLGRGELDEVAAQGHEA
jgi:predicted molibdopterin-dependent oxidoreductase YjgC